MDLNVYQSLAMSTCTDSSANFSYMMLNLVGEVGELASKVAKGIRKGGVQIGFTEPKEENHIFFKGEYCEYDKQKELMLEAGDILWQLSGLCTVMGWDLEDVARMNLDKLAARKRAGTIVGNGDGIDGENRAV